MRNISNNELGMVAGGDYGDVDASGQPWGSPGGPVYMPSNWGGGDGGGAIQIYVHDGTAARDALQRNDAIASFSCDVLGQGFGMTLGILSLEAGPFFAGLVYESVSSGVAKTCNNYLDDQKSNDRKMNNQ